MTADALSQMSIPELNKMLNSLIASINASKKVYAKLDASVRSCDKYVTDNDGIFQYYAWSSEKRRDYNNMKAAVQAVRGDLSE